MEFHGGVSSPAHQVRRCANATSPRLFHGADGGPRPHDVNSADDQDDEDDGDDVGVSACLPRSDTGAPHLSCSNVSLRLEQLASLSSSSLSSQRPHCDFASSSLLSYPAPPTPYSGGTLLTDGSRPTYHRHPHVQNPASGVNVPEFPRAFLLNMHLPRAPGRGGEDERNRRWTGTKRMGTDGAAGFFLSFPMFATGMRDDSIRHHVARPRLGAR